jgi:tetratricopeptide (TPR) repeat protein
VTSSDFRGTTLKWSGSPIVTVVKPAKSRQAQRHCEIISPMKATIAVFPTAFLVFSAFLAPLLAQTPGSQPQQPEFIKQGQQLMREGKLDDALALYRETLQTSPTSVPANIAAGSVLDLKGQGEEARKYFTKAIEVADTPEHKAMAQRAMAMSYAFEGNCKKTVEYEQQVFDYYGSMKNYFQQGEIADEAARVCIDSGDLDAAYHWYQVGHDTGLKEPDIKPARQDLWEFRWEHAQARIAARRGNQAEAQKHVAAAKAILDKGTNPEQAQFLPYLQGYVAFYAGDYKAALDALLKANQNDPFIHCMLGQTYEKLGDKDKALEYYKKASAATSRNSAVAYAVPFARKKLASLPS